ncbi:MAG: dihydropteroate synthase [Planctomycetaceae bacterium]|nr:dihydropteroate synthase [Planctomycetaceae bacterium]
MTGRLAEHALRRTLEPLGEKVGFDYQVAVLGISVAALMHTDWVAKHLPPCPGFQRVVLPGWCRGDLAPLDQKFGTSFERGPKDLQDLPDYFGKKRQAPPDYGKYAVEILAEINHAPRLTDTEILKLAERYRLSGADLIDLGCVPGELWPRVGQVTRQLVQAGFRVSIDSFEQAEVETAVAAGAELVLSCNSTNRDWASKLPAELVVIPDDPRDLSTLRETVEQLKSSGSRFRLDPVLEPIGFGFAESLGRYLAVRREFPDVPMMMGIGNLTELSEVDSAGINLLLAGFCEEQQIRSVLATEVINWCRSAVQEFDIARRLVHHSVKNQVLPKHVDSRLVMLRDTKPRELGAEALADLAANIKDANFRIFSERGEIHILNRDGYWHGTDPYELFDQLPALDSKHAFYLGYELAKAVTALTLSKQYRQDEALNWGFLTIPEISAHERRKHARAHETPAREE